MDCEWSKRTSDFLSMTLAKDYTSVSYALQVNGELVAADALGWQDQPENVKADTRCTYNVASVSKIYCTAAVMVDATWEAASRFCRWRPQEMRAVALSVP